MAAASEKTTSILQRRIVIFCLVSFVSTFTFCSSPQYNLAALKKLFSTEPYIPTWGGQGDGWPEARRRKLIGHYLDNMGVKYRFRQDPIRSNSAAQKYKRVTIELKGRGRKPIRSTTLALIPTPPEASRVPLARRQRQCDIILFSDLLNLEQYLTEFSQIDLAMTDNCIGLTPQPGE
jgi:hypothetical protein